MIVYLNGQYLPKTQAAISVDDRGFLFADGIYEVVRSYHGHLFQFEAHLQRLQHGLAALRIGLNELPNLREISQRLLAENNLANAEAIVYYQITRGAASPRTHAFPVAATSPTIYVAASLFIPPLEKRRKGIAAFTVPDLRWSRCDLKTISLLANCLAKQQAQEKDADEAIFVRDGVALEGSTSNLFLIKDDVVITNPKTNYILPGITRLVVIDLCRQRGIELREAPVLHEMLMAAEEVFITHTTGEVVPMVRVDNRVVAGGAPGPITRSLQGAFTEAVDNSLQ